MSYLFKDRCFETVQRLHEFVAADCPVVSDGFAIKCTPSSTDILIRKTNISGGLFDDYIYTPELIPCAPDFADLTAVLWETSLIWVAAFTVAIIAKRVMR